MLVLPLNGMVQQKGRGILYMVDTCLLPEHIIVGLLSGLFSLFYIFFTVDIFSGTVNKFHLARECFCE